MTTRINNLVANRKMKIEYLLGSETFPEFDGTSFLTRLSHDIESGVSLEPASLCILPDSCIDRLYDLAKSRESL